MDTRSLGDLEAPSYSRPFARLKKQLAPFERLPIATDGKWVIIAQQSMRPKGES
jgi:hypothetical protein